MGSVAQTRRTERRADVQGLRAVAVLLVVAFHAGLPVPGGFIGVDVFFVISGFVIARLLLAELEMTTRLDLVAFYTRRVRRLLPALTVLLVVVAIASGVLLSPLGPQQATAKTGIGASLFGANFQLLRSPSGYFDLQAGANALLHTWWLSLEEQFYFVFPTALLFAWRFAKTRGSLLVLVVAAMVGSFALSCFESYGHGERLAHLFGGSPAKFAFYAPFTRAWEFGAGVIVAMLPSEHQRLGRRALLAMSAVGAMMLLAGSEIISEADPFPGVLALLPVAGTALLISGGRERGPITSVLSARPMVWLGDVSYGWYLWHWPAIAIAHAAWPNVSWAPAGAAFLALAPTWLSYRFVEQPIRSNEWLVGRRAVVLVIGCVATSVLGAAALMGIGALERRTSAARELAATLQQHADLVRGCAGGPIIDMAAHDRCTWAVDHSKGTIVLVGDSNAGQFTEAVATAANSAGYDFKVATRQACPFIDLQVNVTRHDARGCQDFVERSAQALGRAAPALVIIASASSSYVNEPATAFVDPHTRALVTQPEAKAHLWEVGVRSIVQQLANDGIPIVLIHTVPHLEHVTLATCPFFRIRSDVDRCAAGATRAEIEQQQEPARTAEDRALANIPGAVAVDLTDALCSAQSCPVRSGRSWLYRDGGHLSVFAAGTLAPRFSQLIADHARGASTPR